MLRFLIIAIPSFLIGCLSGAVAWHLFSPLFIDRIVHEQLVRGEGVEQLLSGRFEGADAAHKAIGTALVVRRADGFRELQLKNFRVTNGPALVVYLSESENPVGAGDVQSRNYADLGHLRGNVGDQAYVLPSGLDLDAYKSVVIWCEQFSVLFAAARLEEQASLAN